jgi:dipeptidyl-peptidase-4
MLPPARPRLFLPTSLVACAASWVALSTPACVDAKRPPAASASSAPSGARSPTDAAPSSDTAAARAPRLIDRDFVKRMALSRSFNAGKPRGAPTPDGTAVLFLRSGPRDVRQSLFALDVGSGAEREILSPDAVARGGAPGAGGVGHPETVSPEEHARRERLRIFAGGFTAFETSLDSARVLVSLSGRLHVLTRATGAHVELRTGEGAAIDPHFSPDGRRVAYVRGADLYAVPSDGTGVEVAITRGGTPTRTHGAAEFVAQEELERYRGFWWSPDGAQLLYEEADTSKVETWSLADPGHPERAPELARYPRPGRPIADVRLGLVSARGGATTWIDWDRARLPYVAKVEWARGGPLAIFAVDRPQKNGELLRVDAATGRTRVLVKEHDDAWVNVDPSVPRFLADGRFLWSTERSGHWQLELRDASGEGARALTDGAVGYRALVDVDEARGEAIFAGSEVPSEEAIYAATLASAGPLRTVAKVEHGVVDARFADAHGVFVAREGSRTASMPTYRVRHVDGSAGPVIPSRAEDPGFVPRATWTTAGDGAMEVVLIHPRDFDPRRRYAIIDAAYGGPHHAQVVADASRYLREQWIADTTGAVVALIDARGTPGRDRAWERAIDHALGRVPLEGHVDALAALVRAHAELDGSRIGVYGWSFGGYFAALAALERPDVYKVAVAGAPVTDWSDYDSCYTERYLGLPSGPGDAYDRASLLPRAAVAASDRPGARGMGAATPLLVVHGTADDNVFFTHALRLTDALERGGRPFELMPLVGVTHMPVDPDLAEALWVKVALHLRARLE